MTTTFKTAIKLSTLALATAASLGMAQLAHAQQPGDRDHGPQHGGPQAEQRREGPGAQGGPGGPGGPGGDRHYDFRDSDRQKLRQHYSKDIKRVDRGHRPDFRPGQPLPPDYRGRIKPVPQSVRRGLPPPPSGYQMGYYGGYTVVYDPVTFTVLQVLDILR
jgi:Ni/Co efflux regulator RcnB